MSKIGKFVTGLGICLLAAAGGVSAEPAEPCEFDGQTGYSYETVGGLTGYHLWQCNAGRWDHVTYCGIHICIV